MDNIDLIKNKIKDKKHILLSLDLDDTFVNRSIGDNYVSDDNLKTVKIILEKKNITVIINTGRERYGYESFCIANKIDTRNAILGSGSVIEVEGVFSFDENAAIEKDLVVAIYNLIENQHIPFADVAYFYDRCIVHGFNESAKLFFSQNPTSWFDAYPKLLRFDESMDLSQVFRIELPLPQDKYTKLCNKLDDKKKNWFSSFQEILPTGVLLQKEYFLKRKSDFKGILEDKIKFCRIEVDETKVNKGTGLKLWIQKSGLKCEDFVVIHIGDKDSGIVNDTIIKSEIPQSLILMVGDDFEKSNPLVDTYFDGDVDLGVGQILNLLQEAQ